MELSEGVRSWHPSVSVPCSLEMCIQTVTRITPHSCLPDSVGVYVLPLDSPK